MSAEIDDMWADFLNPDVIKKRFVRAGLFLVAHEILIGAIKDRLHEFYSDTWTAENGWETSAVYREKVLVLDQKSKSDPMRASIAWLKNYDVINEEDEISLKRLTDERNRVAHELRGIIGGTDHLDFDKLFLDLINLVMKIDRWWVINVHIATDPDMMEQEVVEDEVTPGSIMILQILSKIALGEDEEAWDLYREFVVRTNRNTS